jgi:hypothetical protein
VSAEITPSTSGPAARGSTGSSVFGRAAWAILATMLLLIVALTGILVETTTWKHPSGAIEVPSDPGGFAQR